MSLSPRDLVFRSAGETLGAVTRYAGRLQPWNEDFYFFEGCRGSRYVHGRRGTRSTEARMNVGRRWL